MKKDFKCRVCGCTKYSTKTISNGNGVVGFGGRAIVEYYYCNNCSAIFKDPKKFSLSKK